MARAAFNLTFSAKQWFFDRKVVEKMVDSKTREALAKAGALVRTIARRSMRYVTTETVSALRASPAPLRPAARRTPSGRTRGYASSSTTPTTRPPGAWSSAPCGFRRA
jgi:hypothetical protein